MGIDGRKTRCQRRSAIRHLVLVFSAVFSLAVSTANAQDISRLTACVTGVFRDLNRTGAWSGKAPAGCPAKVSVEKRASAVFVIAWTIDTIEGGWIRTALSAAMETGEITGKKALASATADITRRAGHLRRCLTSITTVNDPLDCRDHATTSYQVDEESGVETKRLIWLEGNGRHCVVEYTFGTTAATPTPPVDLFSGQQLPPGSIINLRIKR